MMLMGLLTSTEVADNKNTSSPKQKAIEIISIAFCYLFHLIKLSPNHSEKEIKIYYIITEHLNKNYVKLSTQKVQPFSFH